MGLRCKGGRSGVLVMDREGRVMRMRKEVMV